MTWIIATLKKLWSMFFPDTRLAIGILLSVVVSAVVARYAPSAASGVLVFGTLATIVWAAFRYKLDP